MKAGIDQSFASLCLIGLAVVCALSIKAPALAENGNSDSGQTSISTSQSTGVALTVYNQNFALVKDSRRVSLVEGINYVRFEDVAAAIDPTTVNFMSVSAPNSVVVREQNYQYDIMDPETILAKSVGKEIAFRKNMRDGTVRTLRGFLLNSPRVTVVDINGNTRIRHQGLVLRTESGVVLSPSGEVEIAEIPRGLVSRPSLLWKLEATKSGEHETEISYQTGGMKWRCDYVAIANQGDTQVDLASWVTLDNKSGTGYRRASLKLLAGDVHRVQNARPEEVFCDEDSSMEKEELGSQFSEKSFAEYHLYSLAGKTDVNNNETKQLSLFNANHVPSKKLYVFEPGRSFMPLDGASTGNKKVNVKLEIDNSTKNNLGMALPKGKMRVFKKDQDGALQFIGEDLIDHTPRDEKIRIYIGDAFDLVGERKQLSYSRPSSRLQRRTIEIRLRNHKDSDVTITAVEHAWGDWRIRAATHEHKKKDATTFEFTETVPAREEVKITYEIETKTR